MTYENFIEKTERADTMASLSKAEILDKLAVCMHHTPLCMLRLRVHDFYHVDHFLLVDLLFAAGATGIDGKDTPDA